VLPLGQLQVNRDAPCSRERKNNRQASSLSQKLVATFCFMAMLLTVGFFIANNASRAESKLSFLVVFAAIKMRLTPRSRSEMAADGWGESLGTRVEAYRIMTFQSEKFTPMAERETSFALRRPNAGAAGQRLATVAPDHRTIAYRIAEWLAAFGALIFFAPLLFFMAILIKLDSKGPVFFTQKRLTRGGKPFTFIKLRSMAADGDRRFPGFSPAAINAQETGTLKLQLADDPRVTRIGRWLRRTSIDEIPNFLHVLTGHMALVGPRPEMPEYLSHYSAEQMQKFSVLPGITGYAQIYGRGDLTFLETLDHDLRYVKERSTATDIRVLRETIGGVLACRGAQ
jgi:lipopolysaccharide/colanic/teichoic acid biosynthesis glycosyltransferase